MCVLTLQENTNAEEGQKIISKAGTRNDGLKLN